MRASPTQTPIQSAIQEVLMQADRQRLASMQGAIEEEIYDPAHPFICAQTSETCRTEEATVANSFATEKESRD
jgi:hypothetical protein